MYIFVNKLTNVIVGSATRPVNEEDMEKQGNLVYEIDNSEFSDKMIGQKLSSFSFD